ncbi:uncharacterized protein LOC128336820 isoform X2 [Hemicordylus capensis]|uniref:uncharacterized protein LOC128336820 isoform X2 n=1 Tax=Hemicordylus capensis TaxID=884348 RepID=UPI002304C50C|nr:uncharacterized protein LOC128336820 isoform X2 [Hemicordylus capensis]
MTASEVPMVQNPGGKSLPLPLPACVGGLPGLPLARNIQRRPNGQEWQLNSGPGTRQAWGAEEKILCCLPQGHGAGPATDQPPSSTMQPYVPPESASRAPPAPVHVYIQNPVVFGANPVYMRCPYCGQIIMTHVFYNAGLLTWMAAGFLCLVGEQRHGAQPLMMETRQPPENPLQKYFAPPEIKPGSAPGQQHNFKLTSPGCWVSTEFCCCSVFHSSFVLVRGDYEEHNKWRIPIPVRHCSFF